ncbi:MAG TPA: PPC domain-containing DNA-binding protein [Roseomonas sp.]|jgi:hypothetical protein
MHSRQIHAAEGRRSFVIILDEGEEAMASLQAFARAERVGAARVTAIGAFAEAELAFWDIDRKTYLRHPVTEQTEVVSLLGDIVEDEQGVPALHLHAVLGRRDGSTLGGHFMTGQVRPTLEVMVDEAPTHLRRRFDPRLGLATIRA